MRHSYWSCSLFAAKIRNIFNVKKPTAATSEEWSAWKSATKVSNSFLYWFTEEFLNTLQDIVYYPYDVYRSIRVYISNRFIHKVHYLPTKLAPGKWYDLDTRLINGLFESLVQFVEVEKAAMNNGDFIGYLDWEISLVKDDGTPTLQSEAAKTVKELYLWWKVARLCRPDPYVVSGWEELHKNLKNEDFLASLNDNNTERSKLRKSVILKMDEIEKQYEDEDTDNMIRLIKLRNCLWT